VLIIYKKVKIFPDRFLENKLYRKMARTKRTQQERQAEIDRHPIDLSPNIYDKKTMFSYGCQQILIKLATTGLLFGLSVSTMPSVIARDVSPRLLKLGLVNNYLDLKCPENLPYCYRFEAIVDIDSGYLRVWARDEEGSDFVINKLYKGDIVKVTSIEKQNGQWIARLFVGSGGGYYGWVELKYLR
jgi:hypothetical protein